MKRILLQSRQNLFKKSGGDTIQIKSLAQGLRALGHRVEISLDLTPDLRGFDLVHCFNITRLQETFCQVSNARNQGVPVVLSPVFHNLTRYFSAGVYGWRRFLAQVLSYDTLETLRNFYLWAFKECESQACSQFLSHGYVGSGKRILHAVQGMVVNSAEEAREVYSFFQPAQTPPVQLIPIGISIEELDQVDDRFVQMTRLKDYILCVGRLEDLKNQIRILRAVENLTTPIVFIGQPNPNHGGYVRKFKRLIRNKPHIHWFENLDRSIVLSAMKSAKVHILASFIETTGLSNLEAGYLGANIVSTQNGYSREIFKHMIDYCDPEDTHSIGQALKRALDRNRGSILREYIARRYTETQCALKHDRFYGRIIDDSKVGSDLTKSSMTRLNLQGSPRE